MGLFITHPFRLRESSPPSNGKNLIDPDALNRSCATRARLSTHNHGDDNMKLTGLIRISLLISLLGSSALFYAQEREDSKPPQEESRPEASKPDRDENKPARQEEAKPPKQDEAKPSHNEGRADQPTRHDDHSNGTQQGMQHEQRASGQRGGHIPDDKFRSHFGRTHTVVINHPTIVEGQPRFQYSGYWFTIVDPWPVEWAYTDQCYIDYIDGDYFLFDLLHPGVRVALFVVM